MDAEKATVVSKEVKTASSKVAGTEKLIEVRTDYSDELKTELKE